MSDVPSDLYREILIRVPTESLPRLRCVCKAWCQIIDDPEFLRLQLQCQLDGSERLIICKRTGGSGKLYSLSIRSLNYSGKNKKSVEAISVKNMSRRGVSPITKVPVPTCHGLILLCHYAIKFTWTVWNPFTKDFIELPPYEHLTMGKREAFGGIGYDAISDDYKVVRIQQIANSAMETLIYSMKLNTWRRIEDYPYYVGLGRCEYGVFHNGGLYWFDKIQMEGIGVVGQILAFDLGSEKYRQIPTPASFSSIHLMDTYVEAFGGCLFITYAYNDRFDIWMLKDEQGETIWDMFLSLKEVHMFGIRLYYCSRLIFYSKTKQQVVIQNRDDLLWYDVEHKCGTRVSILDFDGSFSCQAFPLSLIRLNGSRDYTCETTTSKGTLKRKRTICRDRLPLKLETYNFVIPSHVEDDSDQHGD